MKLHYSISLILSLFFSNFYSLQAQNFNVEDYNYFLQQHQNMEPGELLSMHPAGVFLNQINSSFEDALYFDTINAYYNLTQFERSLIQDHGFMVSERLKKISFGQSFLEIFNQDLPVFISTDAILHAMHVSYDRILLDMERGLLQDKLIELLWGLHNSLSQLHSTYGGNPEMLTMLKDVDVYVTVPLLLLDENVNPYYPENSAAIDTILNWIYDEEVFESTIFSSTCKVVDWSQFKPRGHYTMIDPITNESLEGYFRAMMWLGRIEIYLTAPASEPILCPSQTFADIQRQIIDAFLISELFDISGVSNIYEEMENVLKFFVGEPDNVTIENMQYLKDAISLSSPAQLLDSLYVVEFQDTLLNQTFAHQLILSQILYSNPMDPDTIVPASAFMFFGQRFVIDSYVTASVVYDRIKYYGEKICRLFPSTLDVLFSLGNNASAQLLTEELDEYHYAGNLAALRYLIDHYNPDFWQSSLYNYWLNSLRLINPPENRNDLPAFMQTAAFWQSKMNTQLASWTELRHDNLLYAKQSYTGGSVCSYPYSYVEPFPDFYGNLKTYCQEASAFFNTLNIDPQIKSNIIYYFNSFYSSADTLQSISQKELNGESFSSGEIIFLQRMMYESPGGYGPIKDGWYPNLFYRDYDFDFQKGLLQSDYLVADIHTTPTDCGGADLGAITHVGTGHINLGIFIAKNNLGQSTAFVGPLMSYYEYTTTNFLRLSDEEWAQSYLWSATRPDWVNIYLADSLGESRGSSPILVTSVQTDSDPLIPESQILLGNYPNPFNPATIIHFTIPRDLTNSNAKLIVYDIQGRIVKTLVDETLSSGNYLSKWDATNHSGDKVSTGVYIYSLQVGERVVSKKMILMK